MTVKKEKNISALEYYKIYTEQVIPQFNYFEQERIKMLNAFNKKCFYKYLLPTLLFGIISFTCILVVFYNKFNLSNTAFAIFFGGGTLSSGGFLLCIMLAPIYYYLARKKENIKFTKMIKMEILDTLLKAFGDINCFCHDATQENPCDCYVSDTELNNCGLFISYNTRLIDDEFKGKYKDVPFKISETKMIDIHGSGKNASAICAFEGVIIVFDFNKSINNRTVISTKGDFTKKNQALATMLLVCTGLLNIYKDGYAHWKTVFILILAIAAYIITKKSLTHEEPLDEVMLEDPKFSKRFNVYSSDQVEARYLATTAFMERFYELQTAFGAKKIKCAFYQDQLIIAINTKKNLFEIGSLYTSLLDPKSIDNFYSELNSIYKMVEYFKLNEKTGL